MARERGVPGARDKPGHGARAPPPSQAAHGLDVEVLEAHVHLLGAAAPLDSLLLHARAPDVASHTMVLPASSR